MFRRAHVSKFALIGLASMRLGVSWAAPGEHIVLGNDDKKTEIVPEVAAGVEFRSNSYLSVGAVQSNFQRDRVVPSANFLLRPKIRIDHTSAKVKFHLDGAYEFRKWFDPQLAANLDRFTDFTVDTRLDVLPKGVVGFSIKENAVIRNRESDNPYLGNSLLTQFRNDAGAVLTVRPGPDVDIQAGSDVAYHIYRVPGADSQRQYNARTTIAPNLSVAWRFFPSTAFVVESNVDLNRWADNWVATNQQIPIVESGLGAVRSYGDFLAKPDSTLLKAQTGLRGRVTRNFVLTALLGWGGGWYDVDSVAEESASEPGISNEADPVAAGFGTNVNGADGLLVTLKTDLDFGYKAKRALGQALSFTFRKDFQDSFFTNYVAQNYLRVDLTSHWSRLVGSSVSASVRFESYVGEVERRDIVTRADLGLLITPVPWLGIDVGAGWAQRASSQREIQYDNIMARTVLNFTY